MPDSTAPSPLQLLPPGITYWAFISYSSEDRALAEKLHRELEQYAVPKELVGREGHACRVPKRIFPIFRDRDELAASADLSASIRTALAASANLIVICSPAATQSRWVNEELLIFRRLGRGSRILPVIAAGIPGATDPANECFPPAIRGPHGPPEMVAADPASAEGTVESEATTPIAADMRPEGDGKDGYKLKLIAGLLGVPLNELRHRELIAAKRRARLFQAIAMMMVVLAGAATVGGWVAWRNQQVAERRLDLAIDIASGVVKQAVDMSSKFGVPQSAIGGLLGWAQRSFDVLGKEDLPDKLKYRQAATLMVFSTQYGVTGDTDKQLGSAIQARALMGPLIKADPQNVDWQNTYAAIHGQIGDAYRSKGRLTESLTAYRQALAIDEQLLAHHPSAPDLLEAIVIRLERIGTAQALQGLLAESLKSQERATSFAERLAKEYPLEAGHRQTLAIQQEKLGELHAKLDEPQQAMQHFQASIELRSDLANQYPDQADYQRELEVAYNKAGQVLLAKGDLDGALEAHQIALKIARKLANSDTTNVEWQSDLGGTQLWLGDVFKSKGDLTQASGLYAEALRVFKSLTGAYPRQAIYQFDLAGSLERIGDIQLAAGEFAQALASYRQKRDVMAQMVATDPDGSEWARDLLVAWVKIGDALKAGGAPAKDIRDCYSTALKIAEEMQLQKRLDPVDVWMIPNLESRIAKL